MLPSLGNHKESCYKHQHVCFWVDINFQLLWVSIITIWLLDCMIRIYLVLGANKEAWLFSRVEVPLYILTRNSCYSTSLAVFDGKLWILATLEVVCFCCNLQLSKHLFQSVSSLVRSLFRTLANLLTGLLSCEFSEFFL